MTDKWWDSFNAYQRRIIEQGLPDEHIDPVTLEDDDEWTEDKP